MTLALCSASISLSALRHNFTIVKQHAPNSHIIAVVKANAYGHGLIAVANALTQANAFAVARVEEGIELRPHSDKPILILSGCSGENILRACQQHQLQPVIHTLTDWQTLKQHFAALPYWLKVDTGMHRLGLSQPDFIQLAKQNDVLCQGVISHLSDAEQLDKPYTDSQIDSFSYLRQFNAHYRYSLANSAAILCHRNSHFDWVRPGIMLYGSNPCSTRPELDTVLTPVMTLNAKVVAIHTIHAGEAVGYNRRWHASTTSKIATIAIGYADGYPRHAKDGTPVWINGKIYPLAGKVSMDLITVDVTDGNIKVGDVAELWGSNILANTVAQSADTISYQLFTGLSQRVPRSYRD